jgi:nitrogen-specific signal transduction histidine kinase
LLRLGVPQELKSIDFFANELFTEEASRARRDKVVVELRLDASLPSIRADRAMQNEALKNIVDNSLQAMSGAGILSLNSAASRAMVELTVSDTS